MVLTERHARQVLGKRLGKGMGAAAEAIKQVTTADIEAYEATGTLIVGELQLKEGDLKVCRTIRHSGAWPAQGSWLSRACASSMTRTCARSPCSTMQTPV